MTPQVVAARSMVPELFALYVVIGVGFVAAVHARRRLRSAADAGLLAFFWPFYGPVLLADGGIGAPASPLAGYLPDPEVAARLAGQLTVARRRVSDIDRLLDRPEMGERAAQTRLAEAEAVGDDMTAAVVRSRVQSIARLRTLRDRSNRELDAINELLKQLEVQAEVFRLVGTPDAQAEALVTDLVDRVEALDAALIELDADYG